MTGKCAEAQLLTSLPCSSMEGGFSTYTACTALPGAAALPAAEEPAALLLALACEVGGVVIVCALTGVTWLQQAHLTDCAPQAYMSVTWQQPQIRWPIWLAWSHTSAVRGCEDVANADKVKKRAIVQLPGIQELNSVRSSVLK